ncbi:MAG TPA: hypothetical protein PLP17_15480, partial [Oligoflexia bacterium]|nr:hypothetical protein [Oligoflexia bacterium]
MAQQSIVDLFYAANKLHAQYEQKYGRKMVAPEQENSSRVLEFVDTQNRKVSVLLELRGDRHALVLLAEMVQKLDRVPPRQILFIVEGLGRQGIEQPRYSPQYLAEEIAQRYKIALTGGIKTVADWDVITEVIAECAVQRPPVPRKRVIGALLLSESLKSWRRSKQNILEAIETL